MTATMVATVRVGVMAPAAQMMSDALTAVTGADNIHAVAIHLWSWQDPLLLDVALISASWSARRTDPWDLLDAIQTVRLRTSAPIVLSGVEDEVDEFVREAADDPSVVGWVSAEVSAAELGDILAAAARRGTHEMLRTYDQTPWAGMGAALRSSRLLAGVAHAVAVKGATNWSDIARWSGFSVRTVQAVPTRFAHLVWADLGLASGHDVTQSLMCHWFGVKADYIRSWCRRHHHLD